MPDYRFQQGNLHLHHNLIEHTELVGANVSGPSHANHTERNTNESEETLDVTGCYVIPGLIDIHLHGCMGNDFCDGTTESL